jgi:hypothetical protein
MTRTRLLLLVSIALVAAAVAWRWTSKAPPATVDSATAPAATAREKAKTSSSATATAAIPRTLTETQKQWLDPIASRPLVIAAAAALPPIDAPLRESLPILKELAQKGNPVAGCRLAAQLSQCFHLTSQEEKRQRYAAQLELAAPGSDAQKIEANNVSGVEGYLRKLHETCDPLPKEDIANAWRYGLNAALAGHLPAIAQFTSSPPLDTKYTNRQPESWEQYRLYTPHLLDIGASAGDRRLIEWQTRLLTGTWTHNGGYNLPPDPERALMIQLVLAKLPRSNFTSGSRGDVDRLRAQLDAEGISRATRRAEEFHANLVARRPNLQPMDGGLMGQDG